jgi:hypothetical protein
MSPSRWRSMMLSAVLPALALASAACTDDTASPTDLASAVTHRTSVDAAAPPPPAGLVTFGSLQLWPWTGRDLSGETADPMNLIFTGDVDVVSLRAALMALDGNRTAFGFPAQPPFDCTWKDAHGEMQTTYSSGDGWVGSAVQLECGDYAPVRFHVRLFAAGAWVLGAVHFDLLIPGTPQHQVLAWELPQQLVTVDFVRSGLLAAAPAFEPVSAAGAVQAIPKPIYDGIPDALKVALGLPPGPAAGPGVPVPNDGVATVLTVGSAATVVADVVEYDLTLPFNQVIPRPFCSAGPTDFVLVQGPVDITVRTEVDGTSLESHNTLRGDLDITPIDISTGQPSGPTFKAQISQIDNAGVGSSGTRVDAVLQRKALPPGVGFLQTRLVTGPNGLARFMSSEKCGAGG